MGIKNWFKRLMFRIQPLKQFRKRRWRRKERKERMGLKKLVAVGLFASFMAMPICNAGSISSDKYAHVGVCTAAGLILAQNKPFCKWPWQRVLFTTIVIGGGKEWYDSRHPNNHTAEWGDVGADFIGALGAEGCVWLVHKSW